MRIAIRSAYAGIRKLEGGPFGAAVFENGKLLAEAHNTVLKTRDATCHAEINAMRMAFKKSKNFNLSGCVIYSTTEPCPMCFSAIHWARIHKVVFGTKIQDVKKRGFHELSISSVHMKRQGKSPVRIQGNFMREECLMLLKAWDRIENRKVY